MKFFFGFFPLFLALFLPPNVNGQNPGNIGTANLTAWFKPDLLPLGNVNSWTTTSSTLGSFVVVDPIAPFPQATNTPVGDVSNYNTTVFFNNNSTTNLQSLNNSTSFNLMQNNVANGQGTFFCAYYLPLGAPSNGHMVHWNNSPHAIQCRNLGANGRIGIGISPTNSTNASRDWTEGNIPTVVSVRGNRSNATSLNVFDNDALVTNAQASQSSGSLGLSIGFSPGVVTAPYNGYVHEVLFYNTNLTPAQMRRVHSYLSIKYGVTMDPTGGGQQGDYSSTTDIIVWDASLSPSYHNHVIGIARDDNQALLQKQSHAFNDNVRLYIGALAANNAANTSNFAADQSYVMLGQTNDNACGTLASNLEAPPGIGSRMAKEWKITKTNFNESFNVDLKVDTCSLVGSSVGAVDPANLRLLVDDDGNFSNAVVFSAGSGLTLSYSNGFVTVTGISNAIMANNSTNYMTIAYNTLDVALSGTSAICSGDSTAITVNFTTPGPINLTVNSGVNSTQLTNISSGHQFFVTPSTTTTYSLPTQANFLNCCGTPSNSSVTITVNPIPTILANASSSSICLGDSTLLSGSGGTTYIWNNGATNGDSISPLATSNYQVVGTDANGCIDSAIVTIQVNALPFVVASSSDDTICIGESVVLAGSGALTYTWTNAIFDNIPFSPTISSTYVVTGTNAAGCFSRDSIEIVVNNLPIVTVLANNNSVCTTFPATVFGQGALSYAWNNGVTDGSAFVPTISSFYTVVGTDGNGCQNIDSIEIIVNQPPNVTANASSNILCQGDSTLLFGGGANTYTWDLGVFNNDSVAPTVSTTYTVIGTDLNGCVDTASILITVNNNPSVSASTTASVICIGQPVILNGSGANTYFWDNSVINNISFNPTTTRTYSVIGVDQNNCFDTANITIIVNNLPNVVANSSRSSVCEGESVVLIGSGALSYTWNNGVMNGISITPTSSTFYTVNGTDINNCSNIDSVFITFYPIVDFFLQEDDTICPQNPVTLFANAPFSSYLWSTGSTAPQISINFEGTYTLTVEDANGCSYSDQQVITLSDDCFPVIFIPNAFTPNGDEHNNSLRTTGDNIDKFEITIFNRWGEVLFVSKDINEHWDGTYAGKICPDGVYIYTVKYKTNEGSDEVLQLNGHVSIVR